MHKCRITLEMTFFALDFCVEDNALNNRSSSGSFKKAISANIKKVLRYLKITASVTAVLMVALIVALIIDITAMSIDYTLEAGEELPSASRLSGRSGAIYDFGDNGEEFNIPGEYKIYIIHGAKRITVRLTVEDTKAPVAEVLALNVAQDGPFPEAIDFFKNIVDASEVEAKFKTEVDPTELDKPYDISIELADIYGNKKTYETTITKIVDNEAPTITLPTSFVGYIGEAVAYRKDIVVTDNCFGEIDIVVDSSAVDTERAGSYKVKYTVTDKSGNTATAETVLVILETKYTYEQLINDKIKPLAATLGLSTSLSKEEQCKIIYAYVNSPKASIDADKNIVLLPDSHTNHSDWITEAYLTLNTGSGDCFSYYAVSKAFFEYLGIENLDIQRTAGVVVGGSNTHFWSMVNIGTEKSPRWYYFDGTRLAGKFTEGGSGCLFTKSQLDSYRTSGGDSRFYSFDPSGYPATDTTVINKNYSW